MPPRVAIVILNWNGKKFLEQFLPSVLATTYAHLRVIVADNASTDDSLAFLSRHYPEVEQILLDRNYGFAKGYNEALRQVEADYFVLLNSDVEVTPGWLEPIIDLMDSNRRIVACQPKILTWSDRQRFEYAGGAGGWIDAYGYPFARGRVFDICEQDHAQYNDAQPVFWASGAALVVRAAVYRELKGFDEFLFAHQEEIDLCWRMQQLGKEVWCCPASVVYHVGGGTLPQGNSRKTFLNFRNNQIILWKNLPLSEKWWKQPFRLALDQVSAVRALLTGDFGFFRAVLRAHFAFFGWLFTGPRDWYPSHRRPMASLKGVFRGNVVWEYFVKKKKHFSDLVGRERTRN